jgi:hypothetical protein
MKADISQEVGPRGNRAIRHFEKVSDVLATRMQGQDNKPQFDTSGTTTDHNLYVQYRKHYCEIGFRFAEQTICNSLSISSEDCPGNAAVSMPVTIISPLTARNIH